jgi:hypothetical protein
METEEFQALADLLFPGAIHPRKQKEAAPPTPEG